MKTLITITLITLLNISSFAGNQNDGVDPTKKAFEKWTKEFVSYPETSTVENETGMVLVSFEISTDGSTEKVQVESGVSETLDQKAIEMVKAMPKEHLYANGFIEGTRFVLPIKFCIK